MMKIRVLTAVALLVVLPGCRSATPVADLPAGMSGETAIPAPPGTAHPEIWPVIRSPLPSDPSMEARITELLGKMTLEEKVGQILQPAITSITPAEVKSYHIGSILNGGGGWPGDVRKATPRDWLALSDAMYAASVDASDGFQAIPIIWGSDAVHGHSNIVGATLFPHNIGLGATRNYELIKRIGEVTAVEMTVTGINWDFSPVVAVTRDDRWGRTYESYSEDPAIVRAAAAAMTEGLQGNPGASDFLGRRRVVATAKHYLGDGGTVGGKDQADNLAPEPELRDIHGAGYFEALRTGVQAIMVSQSSWHGHEMHGNRSLLTGVLKDRLGFDGILVGDWNGHGQVPGCTNKSCPISINAGLDMFMVPDDWKDLYNSTLAQVRSGEVPIVRLEDAVRRILRVKMRAGLFTAGPPSQRPLGGRFELLGSPDHRAVARQAVRESLVLLKNNAATLPLSPGDHVLVAGDGADNIAKQSGGWTLTWQGDGNTNKDFPGGTSIWTGIRETVERAGGRATLSVDGSFTDKPTVAIVVFGEDPYAEWEGDRPHLVYENETALGLLQRLRGGGIPVVSVFLSGRPLWVNPFLNASDAFVAAWLPGTEGGGIAEVLFRNADGSIAHDFRGKLSFSWPKFAIQTAVNAGQAGYDPLFPFGFGLTYGDRSSLPELPTDTSGVVRPTRFFSVNPIEPWKLHIDPSVGEQQEPAGRRVLTWSGKERGEVFLHRVVPVDLTRELNANSVLAIDLMVEREPTQQVTLTMGCGDDCGGVLDLTALLRSMRTGEWRTIRIPLRCFVQAGADMSRIDVPFRIATSGALGLRFGDIELTPASGSPACPPHAR